MRRFRVVRQNDASDCGAAALGSLALYHRMPIGLERLRDLSGTDRAGASLLGLLRAAAAAGFSARAFRCRVEGLGAMPLPAIAHVRGDGDVGHFVVVFAIGRRGFVVGDPASGVATWSVDEFVARWTGNLLVAIPEATAPPGRAAGPQAHRAPWQRFLHLLRPHCSVLGEAVVCALLMTGLAIATSYFVQHLVDTVLVRQDARLLDALGVGMVLIVVFRTLFGILRQYLLAHVGRKVDLALISGYARHVLSLPLRFFETRRTGEILSRVTDASKLREAINGTTTTAVVDGVLVTLLLGVLWCHDAPLALVATLVVPLMLASVAAHHGAVTRRSREAMENGAQLSSHLIEDVAGIETVKVFGAERQRAERGEARLVDFVQSLFSLQKLDIRVSSLGLLVTGMAGVAILWFGGHRVMSGALTLGQLMFFYTMLSTMLEPLNRLAAVNLQLQDAMVAMDRLYQVLDLDAERTTGDGDVELTALHDGIELDGVSFCYGESGAAVLDRIDLRIRRGETVAIVGESGCGKSTLLKLLLSLYEPTAGAVRVDGVDVRDLDLGSLRQRIGFVSQEPFVFNGTIRDNITLGHDGASLDEIIEVCRAARLDELIATLPRRYDTVIGERGANLSGGQRQRLAIARALLRRPDILIFDEATSHLDSQTERAIVDNLSTALAGKTVVLVAHRLSTVQHADRIFVLRDGKIVEQGTHTELLHGNDTYRRLWTAQTRGACA